MEGEYTESLVDAVRVITSPFSQWASRVQAESLASPTKLYEQGSSSQPVYHDQDCMMACCCFLTAMSTCDDERLSKLCSTLLVSDGAYRVLGEGTAADWEGISEWLAARAGTQTHHPAWLQIGETPEDSLTFLSDRLRLACCASEVAVLMLRLAVRAACLARSWYGPWDSLEALEQLAGTKAWESLLQALRALLGTFGPNLAKQYNALNIVSDILHVSPSPSSVLARIFDLSVDKALPTSQTSDASHASADLL